MIDAGVDVVQCASVAATKGTGVLRAPSAGLYGDSVATVLDEIGSRTVKSSLRL